MAQGHGGKRKGAGRPAGSKDKITQSMQQTIIEVFEHLQNNDKASLKAVSEEHPQWFYQHIATKLLPHLLEGSGKDGQVILEIIKSGK